MHTKKHNKGRMHFMYNLMYNLMYFDVQTAGVHWCQCSLGRSGAKAPPGALKRAIYSKNFLQDKGSISDKESISGKGSISDKESIPYIISPKNRASPWEVHNIKHQTHISGACLASPTMKSTSNLQERVTHQWCAHQRVWCVHQSTTKCTTKVCSPCCKTL